VNEVVVNCDGGARGNPGPAAFGFSIQAPEGNEIDGHGGTIGHATNNVAEYTAVIRARIVHLRSDSQLLIEQLKGNYRVKAPGLIPLALEAKRLARGFEKVTFTHVRREFNVRADELVNLALDGLL